MIKRFVEKLPEKYQDAAYVELVCILWSFYSNHIVHFIAFVILNLVVFSIGIVFFDIGIFRILGYSIFNAIWMAFAFYKIEKCLRKLKK